MANDGRETEIKLPAPGASQARRLLRGAGFRVAKKRAFERNTLYDTETHSMQNSSRLLRVREIHKEYLVTFKGPPEPGRYKDREEIETGVEDGQAFVAILQRLGYSPTFRYEKFRTEFRERGSKGVATLDETPIGVYFELEGDPQWIDRAARKLGYGEKDYITASYARLFFDWRERTGSAATDMSFDRSVRGVKSARN